MQNNTWQKYYDNTKNIPPRPLLVKAAALVTNKDKALDLGSGAMNDVRYLLSLGFKHVTAVDSETSTTETLDDFPKDQATHVVSTFEHFDFKVNEYDLINAQYSLPFNPADSFLRVFDAIIKSLKHGGIFTGQLFGVRDQWNTPDSKKTFHTVEDARSLFFGLKTIGFTEEENDGKTAAGKLKHWHVFHFIVQKV